MQNLPTYKKKVNTQPFYSPRPIPSQRLIKSMDQQKKLLLSSKESRIIPDSPWNEKELIIQLSKSYKYNEHSLKLAVAASLRDILMLYDKKIKPERSNGIHVRQGSDIGNTEPNINKSENTPVTLLVDDVLSPNKKSNKLNYLLFI